MNASTNHFAQFTASAALLLLMAACGGGGGSDNAAPAGPAGPGPVATTNVAITVVDGPIKNATVCLDKNGSGACEADETQGKTDANGAVTLAVPNADVGKYTVLAVIDKADAVDADTGAVPVSYVLTAPGDQAGVVSPLSTLVQQTVATTGATTAVAAKSIQDATGITSSPLLDFTKSAAPTDGTLNPAAVARLVVITMQRQAVAIAASLGTPAIDGKAITRVDLDRATQKKVLELLPSIVTALGDASVTGATTSAAREAALLASANTLVASSGLSVASVPTVVAINTQGTTNAPVVPGAPVASLTLAFLNFSDSANYYLRVFTASVAQNTPDANNAVRYVDRHTSVVAGNVARWGAGGASVRNTDVHWNGTAWVTCPINFANTASVRDGFGNSVYDACDKADTGNSSRASFDIAGRRMSDVYAQVRAAGYTNLTIGDASQLGTATFPANSRLLYQSSVSLTDAISYYPGSSVPGISTTLSQYSAAVSAGGTATSQAAGVACNATETQGNGTTSTTLESFIAAMSGTPCIYAPGTFIYGGVTYSSGPTNEWWSNSTASIGTLGTQAVGSGVAPGYYTGNVRLRVAFKGTGTNPLTYYACQERFNNGSSRNCVVIGIGTYTITTLGNGRVLTLGNPPLQAAALNYTRVFVERGGLIYSGFQNKPAVTNSARFNTEGTTAFLTQLGAIVDDPAVPIALTAGSYQGAWDVRGTASNALGISVFLNANGTTTCQDRDPPNAFFVCSLTITNPFNGSFTFSDSTATASGVLDFMTGAVSGSYHDTSAVPVDGAFAGHRR